MLHEAIDGQVGEQPPPANKQAWDPIDAPASSNSESRQDMNGWLGVVAADHVRRGVELGIAQIGHGKRAPLARMRAGDTLIYYSPVEQMGDAAPLREFTAFGVIADDDIWQADEGTFKPFRRRVNYLPLRPVPLAALRDRLHLTAGPNWGYQLRLGLVPLDGHDVEIIRQSMQP
ncbi:EVE domain-containing protein [Arthrobacter sp.]|uniref:EVE domain-containing protein n=1 Tax=Arthrobacter sp. TaxID=1667 RepID=UPI0026DEFF4A|nr:EVE domain-containing protein [Arthrobacter sp.]MDO5752799.1 EVE domain-containing protein [Arthrobacter sp.]